MNIINIKNIKEKDSKKVEAVFGTVLDLAISINKQWSFCNRDLCLSLDKAMLFIYKEILVTKKRNFIKEYFFKKQSKKYLNNLIEIQRSLQFLSIEIESLIGAQVFTRAGLKNKIKTKKLYDDRLCECREITTMLIGVIVYKNLLSKHVDYNNEIEIINKLLLENDYKYYSNLAEFLLAFSFK